MKYPCLICGYYLDASEKICPFCKSANTTAVGATDTSTSRGAAYTVSHISSLMNRYRDAYLAARVIVSFGRIIKVSGAAIGILLVIIGFMFIGEGRAVDATFAMGFVSIVFGVIAGALFYIVGVLVSAQGQILKASLDSAVNSSPFLTNEHRAKIMSLSGD
jgi:uncharacterized OB-fold protein